MEANCSHDLVRENVAVDGVSVIDIIIAERRAYNGVNKVEIELDGINMPTRPVIIPEKSYYKRGPFKKKEPGSALTR
jgi:hypothetical protein